MSMRYQAGIVTASYFPLKVPNAPTIGTATFASSTSVSVTFTAPSNVGGGAITSYVATARKTSDGTTVSGTGASSPITISGLTTGSAYTVTVAAVNAFGAGPASAASNSVTPQEQQFWSWGLNSFGMLGLGNTTTYSSPKQVGALTTWAQVSVGNTNCGFGISFGGTLWSWGWGLQGQLGHGNITTYYSPKQIGSLTTWAKVSGAAVACFAIRTNGTLWAWGQNNVGQLGLNNTTAYSSPKQIGALTNWLSVSGGYRFGAAIKTDGTLWTWGSNDLGELGLGDIINRSSPVQVGSLTNWASVFANKNRGNCFAITTSGGLWAWGENAFGNLGLGDTANRSSPVQVGALLNWLAIAASSYSVVAVKTDGTLWTWGRNNSGQLGLGNTTDYSSPKQVGALTAWLRPTAGGATAFAVKTDGTLWAWGTNGSGQLGLGDTTARSSPVQVGALTKWQQISAAANTLAIRTP